MCSKKCNTEPSAGSFFSSSFVNGMTLATPYDICSTHQIHACCFPNILSREKESILQPNKEAGGGRALWPMLVLLSKSTIRHHAMKDGKSRESLPRSGKRKSVWGEEAQLLLSE